ncbi:MAG: hypothetical protein J6Y13_10585 [Treponema sp.]|nr:hypothetical protein [Treponema sp.]
MYLLYADDSGVSSDPNVQYSVLAGFATSETQTFWIQKAVKDCFDKDKNQIHGLYVSGLACGV